MLMPVSNPSAERRVGGTVSQNSLPSQSSQTVNPGFSGRPCHKTRDEEQLRKTLDISI